MLNYLKNISVLNLFLLISSLLFSQNLDLQIEYITKEHGLSHNGAYLIKQDYQGFLWIGTENGLNRYDGHSFKLYLYDPHDENSITDNDIWMMHIDKAGTLWVGTSQGLNRYDRIKDHFIRYKHSANDTTSLSNNQIWDLSSDRHNTLYIATSNGFNIFNSQDETFTHIKFDSDSLNTLNTKRARCIIKDSFDYLWLGTDGNGLICYNKENQEIRHYRHEMKNANSISSDQLNLLYEDKSGTLWLSTPTAGLNRYNRKTDNFKRFRYNPKDSTSISNNGIHDTYEDSHGKFWVATRRGLNLFNRKKRKVIQRLNTGLSFTMLMEDNYGTIWCGTSGRGIAKITNKNRQFPNTVKGIRAYTCYEDQKGVVWLGLKNRLANLTENNGLKYWPIRDNSHPNPLYIVSICEDRSGALFLCANNTIYEFNKNKGEFEKLTNVILDSLLESTTKSDIAAAQGVKQILFDKNDKLWITTNIGLISFDKSNGFVEQYQHDPANLQSLSSDRLHCLFFDSGGLLWIPTWNGLNCFDPKTGTIKRFQHDPNDPTSLSTNAVSAICGSRKNDENTLWIGTQSGLNRFNTIDGTFEQFNNETGPIIRNIRKILEDNSGNLWITTYHNLIKFDPKTGKTKIYDESNGLFSRFSSYDEVLKTRNGVLCFTAKDGFTYFHPDSIKEDQRLAPIVITKFKKNNRDIKLDTAITEVKQLILTHNDKVISFEFAALDLSNPKKNQYAYKMEGFDSDWIYSGNKHDVTYTNLSPGNYIFRVKGTNHDGVWNEAGTSLQIVMLAPWWKTRFFHFMAIALFLAGILLVHKLRVRYLKVEKRRQQQFSQELIESQEKERKRIAGELHDGLGQNLLIIYNEIQQFFQETGSVPQKLENFVPAVKETIDEVREIARDLHPHQLEQLGLTKAIQAMIRKIEHSDDINFTSDIDFIDNKIPAKLGIHLYRIIQEALTNVMKHSKARNVQIRIKDNTKLIKIRIIDDGIGLKRIQGKSSGFGLDSLKERARLLNAYFKISSPKNGGTKILLDIPIEKEHSSTIY